MAMVPTAPLFVVKHTSNDTPWQPHPCTSVSEGSGRLRCGTITPHGDLASHPMARREATKTAALACTFPLAGCLRCVTSTLQRHVYGRISFQNRKTALTLFSIFFLENVQVSLMRCMSLLTLGSQVRKERGQGRCILFLTAYTFILLAARGRGGWRKPSDCRPRAEDRKDRASVSSSAKWER